MLEKRRTKRNLPIPRSASWMTWNAKKCGRHKFGKFSLLLLNKFFFFEIWYIIRFDKWNFFFQYKMFHSIFCCDIFWITVSNLVIWRDSLFCSLPVIYPSNRDACISYAISSSLICYKGWNNWKMQSIPVAEEKI